MQQAHYSSKQVFCCNVDIYWLLFYITIFFSTHIDTKTHNLTLHPNVWRGLDHVTRQNALVMTASFPSTKDKKHTCCTSQIAPGNAGCHVIMKRAKAHFGFVLISPTPSTNPPPLTGNTPDLFIAALYL